jgi:hypothetical protein
MAEVLPWCAVAFLLGALSGITLTIVLLRRYERRYELSQARGRIDG